MNILPWRQPSSIRVPVSSPGDDYARLIVENLPYIEKQCLRAVSRGSDAAGFAHGGLYSSSGACADNEADELLNEVLDHLKADDFRVLRQFQGKAKLTTYLTTIIANLVVDLLRKKKGRSRVRERAREMGDVAERLYEAVYQRGYSIGEAHSFLHATWGVDSTHAELEAMLERMQGRESQHRSDAGEWPYSGKEIVTGEGVEIVVPDPARSAEEMLADDQREKLSRRVLDSVLAEFSGEERLMLSLRFPADDAVEQKGNREIAQMLGLTEKAVDNRIRRMLTRCREMILKQGLSLDDLLGTGN